MIAPTQTSVSLLQVSNDLVVMEVRHEDRSDCIFDYEIKDGAEKIVRRGRFTGPLVQLGTQFLSNGNYEIDLMVKGEMWKKVAFTKTSF
ncbi:MAG TPA: hypothetical protein VKH37_02600 [Ferruginibacter sp.]|nr:hypothetical protein [Ferruginibacter sp.]